MGTSSINCGSSIAMCDYQSVSMVTYSHIYIYISIYGCTYIYIYSYSYIFSGLCLEQSHGDILSLSSVANLNLGLKMGMERKYQLKLLF